MKIYSLPPQTPQSSVGSSPSPIRPAPYAVIESHQLRPTLEAQRIERQVKAANHAAFMPTIPENRPAPKIASVKSRVSALIACVCGISIPVSLCGIVVLGPLALAITAGIVVVMLAAIHAAKKG